VAERPGTRLQLQELGRADPCTNFRSFLTGPQGAVDRVPIPPESGSDWGIKTGMANLQRVSPPESPSIRKPEVGCSNPLAPTDPDLRDFRLRFTMYMHSLRKTALSTGNLAPRTELDCSCPYPKLPSLWPTDTHKAWVGVAKILDLLETRIRTC
jgi:hypothetical protein